eukprot:1550609-Rhodomonas_salina.1
METLILRTRPRTGSFEGPGFLRNSPDVFAPLLSHKMGNSSGGFEGRMPNEEDLPFLQVLNDKRCLDWRNSPDPETGKSLSAEDERRMKREQGCLPVHISSNVFLSDARSAQKIGRLKHLGIAFVLNVAGKAVEPPNLDEYHNQGIEYKMFDASKETRVLDSYLAEA